MSTKYEYNSQCLMRDGVPWFPVMGEMHYSRYREELWEESLRKMKAGGVSVVSTYVFWIHHEEEKGIFDFSGCRNLRRFVELCGRVGLKVFLRIGPWAHGECRNGGFPDWVVQLGEEGVKLRSNDETYLSYVRRFWEKIFEQVEGLMAGAGGGDAAQDEGPDMVRDDEAGRAEVRDELSRPVIGIQLENEYGHVGGLRGPEGEAHMRTLMALAKELGFLVPLYTATGWGGACIGDALPVMGGYCEAPWDQSIGELSANTNYIISHVRNDALIACDHHVEGAVTFDESRFPYLTAELGGGVQVTGHRRPVAEGKDIGAMSVTKLASGVALLGYYMYHGGSNPKGKLSTLQESTATGYANNLPEINYDFNAPVRQYGTISDTYKEIKLLAAFLQDFGADLAPMPAEIDPEDVKPEDMHTLRKSCRHDGRHGYVFFNNYVRRRRMDAHKGVVFRGPSEDGEVIFPAVDLESGAFGFFPYNMALGDALLVSALATPYCKLEGGKQGDTYVFYGDYDPHYLWKDGRTADVLHLTRQQALDAWKVTMDRDYLVLHDNYVWVREGKLEATGGAHTRILVWPELPAAPERFVKTGTEGRFTVYERMEEGDSLGAGRSAEAERLAGAGRSTEAESSTGAGRGTEAECLAGAGRSTEAESSTGAGHCAEAEISGGQEPPTKVFYQKMKEDAEGAVYEITVVYRECGGPGGGQNGGAGRRDRISGRDTLLWLTYAGYGLEIFCGEEKINDHFYTGQQVPVSLGYFGFPEKLTVKISPLHEDEKIFLEQRPAMEEGRACRLEAVTVAEEYR